MKAYLYKVFSGILIAVFLSSIVLAGTAFATSHPNGKDQVSAKQEPKRGINPETGRVSFIGAGDPIFVAGVSDSRGLTSQDRALGMAKVYGKEFGLTNPAQELKLLKSKKNNNGNEIVHFQQMHRGVPVIGGEMIVNMDVNGQLLSISGEVSSDLALETQPAIEAEPARRIALAEMAALYKMDEAQLTATAAELWIFDEALLIASAHLPELVWRMEVTARDALQPIREMVLINAQTGQISFHVNQVDMDSVGDLHSAGELATSARSIRRLSLQTSTGNRSTYTASGTGDLPGSFLCDQAKTSCTGGADSDADKAHRYAADTYVFYSTHHGRDSFDNQGGTIVSTVHYGVGYQNAFWTGSQVGYGDGMAADDVVGHELTHAVTAYTSTLIYSYQSGAINESFSDVWGEFIDQTNGSGTDSLSVKWLMGEDTPLGAIRSMSDPTLFGDPDKMSSPNYYFGPNDNGGVHWNSGVNNKAAYLMTDGGTFNGRTINGIGLNKVAAVYYEVQTHLLTAGANYNDLYYALVQGCQNLIGINNITQSDCSQVKAAAEAVEMLPPPGSPTATPSPTSTPTYSHQPLYLSLSSSQTVGAVSAADEDILKFDGTNWSLFFDGSDVGVGSPDLSSFFIMDADTLLLSFSVDVTVNGIAATPQDVLRFDATSLGSVTAGTWSMYFDGSDVGFDDLSNEKIDGLSLLPDGRLVISTNGNAVVPGLTTAKDEDGLLFTPGSLGNGTSGTWSMYFDGSDVELADSSTEDVDTLHVAGNSIYLSTTSSFMVNGISGTSHDVFVCAATSLGDVTSCNYQYPWYFQGDTWGLYTNNIDGFNYLASGPAPVPSATYTPTRTATPTVGPAITNTPTATMSAPGSTLTFTAEADTRVSQPSPTTNYGTATTILVDGDAGAAQNGLIRFTTSGISGAVQSAKLRVYCTTNGTNNGPAVYLADNNWTEAGASGVNWNTQPALLSAAFDNKGPIAADSWVEYDVTAWVKANGSYTFALIADGADGITFSSREGGTPPQLVLTLGTSSPAATPTPTKTSTPISITNTPVATQTVTASGLIFTAEADARVSQTSPTTNYGTATTILVDGDAGAAQIGYIRFAASGISGPIQRAVLRVYCTTNGTGNGPAAYLAESNWAESGTGGVNWNTQPAMLSGTFDNKEAVAADSWVEYDVTAWVTGDGTFTFALVADDNDGVTFSSREGTIAPQLVVTFGG